MKRKDYAMLKVNHKLDGFLKLKGSNLNMVTLKNGSKEAKVLVNKTMKDANALLEAYPLIFCEVVRLCQDPTHKTFDPTMTKFLKKIGFVRNGKVQKSIKNVILSAVEGDYGDMRFGSPIAEK